MKTVYKFNPNGHWNYITKEQHEVLRNFYQDDTLRIEEEEE